MNKKKGFTLIELLAIIVILAIIAVITVPIILGIIEEAKKGAAKNSAYGFKDAVQKYYVSEVMDNNDLELNGSYTISSGKLSGPNITETNGVDIPLSGNKPTSGTLVYENNDLKSGCLVIGDYAVTFNEGGTTSTEKGKCIPTIASCPGCKFIYILDTYAIVGSYDEANYSSDMPTEDNGLTNDYTTLIGEGGHPYFLGLIESTTNPGKIGRAFACGVENDKPFCLEGYDPSKYSDDDNVGVLNTIFPSCNASASDSYASCGGSSVYANANGSGYVYVTGVTGDSGHCDVNNYGIVDCDE